MLDRRFGFCSADRTCRDISKICCEFCGARLHSPPTIIVAHSVAKVLPTFSPTDWTCGPGYFVASPVVKVPDVLFVLVAHRSVYREYIGEAASLLLVLARLVLD